MLYASAYVNLQCANISNILSLALIRKNHIFISIFKAVNIFLFQLFLMLKLIKNIVCQFRKEHKSETYKFRYIYDCFPNICRGLLFFHRGS